MSAALQGFKTKPDHTLKFSGGMKPALTQAQSCSEVSQSQDRLGHCENPGCL